jgi:hypothetical protein
MISTTMVASAVGRIARLDQAGRERMLDEVITSQPEPTGFVLALSRMGLPASELDHVLHVLFVIAECFRMKVRKPLPQITKEMLEVAARKISAMGKLLQGDADEAERMTGMIVESHKERNLFAYVVGYLDEHGLTQPSPAHEHAVFAAAVVLEVFMQAEAQTEGAAE